MQETGVDPFLVSLTIASACNYVFRRNFLQSNTIGIVPHGGYRKNERQSVTAIKWLKYIAETQKIDIRHTLNGGEVKIGNYKVDGLCGNTVYEFNGCYYHGCPKCLPKRNSHTVNAGVTAEEAYQRTIARRQDIEARGYTVVEKWECELKQELKTNLEMKDYMDNLKLVTPLEPREAFYGGRTNAVKLYHQCQNGEKIRYIDVCSLYPWVCKTGEFPIE